MYTILLCVFLGLLISGYLTRENDTLTKFLGVVCGWVAGVIIGAFAAAMITAFLLPKYESPDPQIELVSLRSANGVNGSFIFGSGGINSETKYSFLMKNADGSMTPGEIHANHRVRIFEENELAYRGYWVKVYKVNDQSSALTSWAFNSKRFVRHEFHVPVGSVRHGFSFE